MIAGSDIFWHGRGGFRFSGCSPVSFVRKLQPPRTVRVAKHVVTHLIDDLDQKPIPDGSGEQISFSVNGVDYKIDLNDKNATEFHRKLDYYIEHAEKVGRRDRPGRPSRTKNDSVKRDPEQTKAIRDWANANGHDVGPRGRIPVAIVEAFEEAH